MSPTPPPPPAPPAPMPPPPPPPQAAKRAPTSRWAARLMTAAAVVSFAFMAIVIAGLAAGYRPVVLQTGSMGDTAPAGALVVTAPKDAAAIEVGDIIVMENDGVMPVTHRVIEIEETAVGRVVRTQGDANEFPDAAPYALSDGQLVARWIVPEAGTWLERLQQPTAWLALLALVVVAFAARALHKIWRTPKRDARPARQDVRSAHMGFRVSIGVAVVATLVSVGIVLALYSSSAQVASNDFNASNCFANEISSVQSGKTVHTTNGTITEPITAVDMSRSFVTATVRSNGADITDSSAQVVLASPTTVDVIRATASGVPPTVTVDWSVIEYACGISVQRGIATGSGADTVDVGITTVDTSSSFVLLNALAPETATGVGNDDFTRAELTGPTTLTISAAAGVTLDPTRTFAWQVVAFDDPDDATVQTISASLTDTDSSATLTLPTAVDRNATFITTWVTTSTAGAQIGSNLVRASLVDDATVEVERLVTMPGVAIEVHVQAVTLSGGATVQHGTVDLGAATATRSVAIAPVDLSRSSVMSTVGIPGPAAGGHTTATSSSIGEGSASFVLTAPDSVEVTRDATAFDSSFGWQVIEWSGPTWWNPSYGYRQRIDVTASTTAAPDGYTVPFTVDHAALVAAGLSMANGDDLRVLHWNGSAWTELDRVLDDASAWDASDTTMEFRTVDAIAAGATSTYWLYMNNPAATAAPSDPEQVYLLVENFDSGTLGDFEDRTGGTGWYAAAPWTRRIPITIPAGRVASDLTDFPLLVSLSDADIGTRAQADGSDLRFTAADGTTTLSHDLEFFDAGTGQLAAWVTVPSLPAASSTLVYLYYGADDAPAQELPSDVWPATNGAVWHLDRDPSGSAPQLDDVSASNRDGLSRGSMTGADLVAGKIGDGVEFDGVDDALLTDQIDIGTSGAFTASAWVRPASQTADMTVLSSAIDATERQMDLTVTAAGEARVRLALASGEVTATSPVASVPVGAWTHVAARWDGTDLTLIVDASSTTTTPASGSVGVTPSMLVTVGNVPTQDSPFDGILDEVRLEDVARTDAWIAANHASQSSPTFFTIGATESGTYFDQGAWGARMPITVDADRVDADLADFALLVELTEPLIGASAQACGCDIVLTAADGTTRLDHVIEWYDSGTGDLTAWVSVPLLSSTVDTQLFVYYANPTAIDQQDAIGVFGPSADLQLLGVP